MHIHISLTLAETITVVHTVCRFTVVKLFRNTKHARSRVWHHPRVCFLLADGLLYLQHTSLRCLSAFSLQFKAKFCISKSGVNSTVLILLFFLMLLVVLLLVVTSSLATSRLLVALNKPWTLSLIDSLWNYSKLATLIRLNTAKSSLISTCPVFCGPSACKSFEVKFALYLSS